MIKRIVLGIGAVACLLAVGAIAGNSLFRPQPEPRAGRRSPHETTNHVVDGAKIRIVYGRPYMRGRKIFGGLIPYGRVWMPGADEATMFDTSADLRFGNLRLPAGSYSLYTLPEETAWKIIINKQTGQWHTTYLEEEDFARLDAAIERLSTPVEQLTIAAVTRTGGGGRLQLEWETTRVYTPFTVVR